METKAKFGDIYRVNDQRSNNMYRVFEKYRGRMKVCNISDWRSIADPFI